MHPVGTVTVDPRDFRTAAVIADRRGVAIKSGVPGLQRHCFSCVPVMRHAACAVRLDRQGRTAMPKHEQILPPNRVLNAMVLLVFALHVGPCLRSLEAAGRAGRHRLWWHGRCGACRGLQRPGGTFNPAQGACRGSICGACQQQTWRCMQKVDPVHGLHAVQWLVKC